MNEFNMTWSREYPRIQIFKPSLEEPTSWYIASLYIYRCNLLFLKMCRLCGFGAQQLLCCRNGRNTIEGYGPASCCSSSSRLGRSAPKRGLRRSFPLSARLLSAEFHARHCVQTDGQTSQKAKPQNLVTQHI